MPHEPSAQVIRFGEPQARALRRPTAPISRRSADQAEQLFDILMGEKVEPRREFIMEHAKEVSVLDV